MGNKYAVTLCLCLCVYCSGCSQDHGILFGSHAQYSPTVYIVCYMQPDWFHLSSNFCFYMHANFLVTWIICKSWDLKSAACKVPKLFDFNVWMLLVLSSEAGYYLILSYHKLRLSHCRRVVGRTQCPTCGRSRKFYCYSCYHLVGLEPSDVPRVKLPVKVDMYVQ